MSFFAKITVLVLLALWAPATLHCDLEAAGLINHASQTDACCQTSDEPCGDETCRDFTRTSSTTLAAPSVYTAVPWANALTSLLAQLALVAREAEGNQFSHGDTPAIETLARTWSFVRRSALPARAPSSVA